MKKIITITFSFLLLIGFTNKSNAYFNDINYDYSYRSAVEYSFNQGFINGYSDGTFRPHQPITRGEFTKILLNSQYGFNQFSNCNNSYFPDVGYGHTFYPYICYARMNNFINGYSDGYFRPNDFITTGEALKIIINVYNIVQIHYPTLYPYYYTACDRGIMPPTLGSIENYMHRGEMVELIYLLQTNQYNYYSRDCGHSNYPYPIPQGENVKVTDVEVDVNEKDEEVILTVKGFLPTGCYEIEDIDENRSGNTFYIEITADNNTDEYCTFSIEQFKEEVVLDMSGLDEGTYYAYVNDFGLRFEYED